MPFKKIMYFWLCLVLIIWSRNHIKAHPDGSTPYWYPSSYVYGFINGCWSTVEEKQVLSKDMWPSEIKVVCGCVMDSIRHSIPFHEAESKDPKAEEKFDAIARGVLPSCIAEQVERKKLLETK